MSKGLEANVLFNLYNEFAIYFSYPRYGEKSFTEGGILTCMDGYNTDLHFKSDL